MTLVKTLSALALLCAITSPAFAHNAPDTLAVSPPAAPFQAVSALVPLPDFLPGMGQLFVDPATLPAGPFVAYDHDGKLISTIYMLPLSQLTPEQGFDDLATSGALVDHVDVVYNAGHPGVEEPHIHVILWHVSPAEEERVAQ